MKTAIALLKSISPYSQSRKINVDSLPGETAADKEKRVWREHLHVNEGGHVYIPPMTFKNCVAEAAKYLSLGVPGKGKATFTKHFEAGLLVVDPLVLPVKKEDVEGEWLFLNADGRRGSGTRVDKCYPKIPSWSGKVNFLLVDEILVSTIQTPDGESRVFDYVLKQAGAFIGIGRFRPRNNGFYGRFSVEGIEIV